MNIEDTKSKIPSQIIQLLQKNNFMRFTELKDHLTISKPVLSYHLGILKDAEVILFEKKGREKHYRLSPTASKIFALQIPKFTMTYSISAGVMMDLDDHSSQKDIIIDMSKKINAFFFFTILKSIETGENWFKGFDTENLALTALGLFLEQIFEKDSTPVELEECLARMNIEELFKQIKKHSKNKKIQKRIKNIQKNLKDIYPKEVYLLESAYQSNVVKK